MQLEAFANTHEGSLPRDRAEFELLLSKGFGLEGAQLLSHDFVYLPVNSPIWGESGQTLVLMTAFLIDEDRRSAKGRYAVVRLHGGEFISGWADEQKIQEVFARAGISLPEPAVYKEKALWLSSPLVELAWVSASLLLIPVVLFLGSRIKRARLAEKGD